MDLKDAIYSRRSVREFTAEPVNETTIRELIDAAIQAPSAVNQQPYAFCVVRDQNVLATISQEAKAHMVRTTPIGLMSHHFSEVLNDQKFNIFYHAPVLILICTVAEVPWAVEDCALAAENLMLAARGAGLGTCWIGLSSAIRRRRRRLWRARNRRSVGSADISRHCEERSDEACKPSARPRANR
jgi:nitroreductase